jgi:hypothetical protein
MNPVSNPKATLSYSQTALLMAGGLGATFGHPADTALTLW